MERITTTASEIYLSRPSAEDSEAASSSSKLTASPSLPGLVELLSRESESLEMDLSVLKVGSEASIKAMRNLSKMQGLLADFEAWRDAVEDAGAVLEIASDTSSPSSSLSSDVLEMLDESISTLSSLQPSLDLRSVESSFKGKYDDRPSCRFLITAGAGGTEACDWVGMLARMYLSYFNSKGWSVSGDSRAPGDVTGYRSVEFVVTGGEGEHVYGRMKGEKGAHRLVRISPFNSQGKRMTTFAGV
ncbi:hypothetical protein TrRE_jg2785, partial [Triparma retinervis]